MSAGQLVGPYLVGRSLGEGTFGAVYDATHEETGRRVAVKLLHGSKQMEPEVQNRFVREIAILQRLDHDNVVRHFDCGLHNDSIFCAMELVECGTLKDVLARRGALPWRDAAEVALQTARGLAHAHELGCVHRDLKPANLYLSAAGHVKIGDLGLARDLTDSRLTVQGQTVGSWRYMPPEQIRGEDAIDGRLDLYALGCILFEMVAGRVPFDGPTAVSIFDQHLEATAPRLDALMPGTPTGLADLVERLLAKAPADRPADATEVVARLESLLADPQSTAGALSAATPTAAATPDPPAEPLNLTQRLQAGGTEARSVNPRALIVAAGIAAAAAAGWAIWRFAG